MQSAASTSKKEAGYWSKPAEQVLSALGSGESGLTRKEARKRLREYGFNEVGEKEFNALEILVRQFRNPLLAILFLAALVSAYFGQATTAVIVVSIILLSTLLGFYDEYASEKAVDRLKKKVSLKAIVLREGEEEEVSSRELVPGDVVVLAVGNIVPADVRLIKAKELQVNEAAITGESLSVEKNAAPVRARTAVAQDLRNCAFAGTIVAGGEGIGVVVATGKNTEFGLIARHLAKARPETDFQKGIKNFGSMLAKTTLVLALFIFAANAFLKHDVLESLLFALAVAIGLTPELLPAIVTASLSKGAHKMAGKGVVVKRLISVEDFGDMDVLCTDKTGTLTEGEIVLSKYCDAGGNSSEEVLDYALLCNSAVVGKRISGNTIDAAIWRHAGIERGKRVAGAFAKVDELPFDYERRRMSVIARKGSATLLISKGAPEAILRVCTKIRTGSKVRALEKKGLEKALAEFDELSAKGFRVIAVAEKKARERAEYSEEDERGLTFIGFLVFADPPKKDVMESLLQLKKLNVDVKVLTGDNEFVTKKICGEIGLPIKRIVLGEEIKKMSAAELRKAVEEANVFARITPEQKLDVIRALKENGHVVGFLGDGVNDAPALHEADVGVSVNSGVDVAKDAADIVLLHKSLSVLAGGIVEGRKIFANTIKYILMGTSSNFGNMFSVAGASLFLPFLPMLPTQILLTNLLYDGSQLTIPSDNVDEEYVKQPRKWNVHFIEKFMLVFGPISSLYDFLTFAVMLFVFNASPALFQTGWFVESMATQVLIVFVIRTARSPFYESKPGKYLVAGCLAVVAAAMAIPFSPLASWFGFAALPPLYFGVLVAMVVAYLALVELAKKFFYAKYTF